MKISKISRPSALCGIALGAVLLSASAHAATIVVGEHSFEGAKALGGWTGAGAGPGSSTTSTPSPWVESGTGNAFGSGWTDPTQYTTGIPDGDIYVYANAAGNISQTLAATLQADTTYTITVAVGWRADLPGLGFPDFPGYGIELWTGGVKLASDYDTVSGAPASDSWKDATASYSYDAGDAGLVGQALQIRLIGYGIQTNYDNVRLDSTVIPEPSAALLGLGGLLMLLRRRR